MDKVINILVNKEKTEAKLKNNQQYQVFMLNYTIFLDLNLLNFLISLLYRRCYFIL